MKKNLLGWFAMATMLVGTGCSSDEVVNDYSPENAIQFGTYVGRGAESRASVIDDEELKNNEDDLGKKIGFGVFAYYTGQDNWSEASSPNFMKNEQVQWSGTKWTYSPLKYWPNNVNDKVSFFAYAPYDPGYTSVTNPSLAYEVPLEVKQQKDLLYADNTNTNLIKNAGTSGIDVESKVDFNFKHALSRIGFTVQAMIDNVNGDATGTPDDAADSSESIDDGETKISVQKVELMGKFQYSGWLNLDEGTWSTDGLKNYITYTLDSDDFETVANAVTIDKTKLNSDDSYLMLIPRSFDKILDGSSTNEIDLLDQLTIRVTYKVKTMDSNLTDGFSEIENVITSDPFTFTIKQGKAYTFCLHLGLTSVKLSATVTDWTDVTPGTVVNVPINTSTTTP